MNKPTIQIVWLRRDLRLNDNPALNAALKQHIPIMLLFIFDTNILKKLNNTSDHRVHFIYKTLTQLDETIKSNGGSGINIQYGDPETIWKELLKDYHISYVHINNDYEPYARLRDNTIYKILKNANIELKGYTDQVIIEPKVLLKDNGTPYTVFTPYANKWRSIFLEHYTKPTLNFTEWEALKTAYSFQIPQLQNIGFSKSNIHIPALNFNTKTLLNYAQKRDIPAENGTSLLGLYLRFGTISIRHVVEMALTISPVFLNELIWREFYKMILWHYPHVVNSSFKTEYNNINWEFDHALFEAWCMGETGYPIVDAGMRQLNQTGYMHNRVRMITASFLCKHLLHNWQLGEAYFAEKLFDFDLSANNGGWQWAAGTGCDAAPYFRVFNPTLQQQKFDPDFNYIRKWLPEFKNVETYRKPIVQHELARKRAVELYQNGLKK